MHPFALWSFYSLHMLETLCRIFSPAHPAFDDWAEVWRKERERLE